MTSAFSAPLPQLPPSPSVSIVVCNYNHGRFLDAALTSATTQTRPCEVVAIDDGSTDDSPAILHRWSDRVRVLSKPNGGQRSAYNRGLECSSGDIVLFLDADDELRPDAAEHVVAAMGEGVSRVHFRLQLMDVEGAAFGGQIPRRLARGDFTARLRAGCLPASAPGTGNAYRRAALERLLPMPESATDKNGADFFAIYGSSLLGTVVAIEAPLGKYRVLTRPSTGGSGEEAPLVFGNAARGQQRELVVQRRVDELRQWIADRSGGAVQLPSHLADFGEVKSIFAQRVFREGYVEGLVGGAAELPKLFSSVLHQDEFSWAEKVGLLGWATAVLLVPRKWGKPIARYVVDPSSRGASAA